jgi:hypothetical protein
LTAFESFMGELQGAWVRLRSATSPLDGRVHRRLATLRAKRLEKMDCQGRETSGLGSELAIHGLNLIQIISR